MLADLLYRDEASEDISEIYRWYERQREGLGEEFLASTEAAMNTICRLPKTYPIIDGKLRRGLMKRFSYVIYYTFAENRITVYGVMHSSRDPELWRQRYPNS